MDKPWLAQYPHSIPPEISYDEYSSLTDFFESKAKIFAERPAFSNFGTTLTYTQIEEKSRWIANFLRSDLRITKGERVAIMMPNLLQAPVSIFGTLRAGLIVVSINPLYTPRELKYQLNDSGTETIIILENFAHVLASVLPQTTVRNVIITRMGDLLAFPKSVLVNAVIKHIKKMVPSYRIDQIIPFKDALKRGARFPYEKSDATREDIAFLQYTGGTTGVSKGAMLTHGNLLANTVQATAWIRGTSPPERPLEEGSEIIITALPLYHIFALMANCMTFINVGAVNYLITNPRDLRAFVKELKNVPFTCMTGVNTLFNGLLNTPGFDELDFSTVKLVLGGGMAVQRSVADRWRSVTGTNLIEAYGLTETSPGVCINPVDQQSFNGSIGPPLPSTDCCVRNDDNKTLGTGEIGELCVRGPQVMKGYWNRPEETAEVLDSDGWLRTGDIARIDELGYVYIVDRKKDMILVSGFNVYPNEIEEVVAAHPGVLECGAIGVLDEESGEAIKIIVVKKDSKLNEQILHDYCKTNLCGYKRPKRIEFTNELPKTPVGKILRRELRKTESET